LSSRAGSRLHLANQRRERQEPGPHQPVEQHGDRRLQPHDAEGRAVELALFFGEGVRGVIGRDAIDRAVGERLEQRLHVALGPERRGHLGVRNPRFLTASSVSTR